MRRLLATLAALVALGGACSADGDIDTDGDGVRIEGDIDQNE